MRRLARYTLNALTALSLLLCVATVALWVRSYFTCDEVYCERLDQVVTEPSMFHEDSVADYVGCSGGRVHWLRIESHGDGWDGGDVHTVKRGVVRDEFRARAALETLGWYFRPDPGRSAVGFGAASGSAQGEPYRALWVPCWAMTAAFAVVPALRLATFRARAKRARRGLCPHCNYDLCATPGRCPECGTAKGADEVLV